MYRAEEVVQEHGLVGAFDTMVMIHDEELAVIFGDRHRNVTDLVAEEHGSSNSQDRIGDESDVELQGLTFVELQISSQDLAAHLYHRFGVRRGDPVAIICNEYSAAEV
jgi:non-ribosomal peptide synthetase component F